jgi:peptide/nickel transport system ATP-binding protein
VTGISGQSAPSATAPTPLLQVDHLTVEFPVGRHRPPLRAVDDVSFEVAARETVGLVGESGSGKTTIGRAILGLTPVKHGAVTFEGVEITHAGYRQRRQLSTELQVVFQDPYSSLNPTRTIGQTLAETLRAQGKPSRVVVDERVVEMLEHVGLAPEAAARYPAHFSGGQRQRIAIARALMTRPRLVICDEPVSALDLSVQAQVLNLLGDLQREFQLSYLFIAHDLPVVRHLAHRIIVLYRGRIMEQGPAAVVYERPAHPYTQMLFEAAPLPDPDAQRARRSRRRPSAVESLSPDWSVDACPFAQRCPYVIDRCRAERPLLEAVPGRSSVACHRWREIPRESDTSRPSRLSSIR